MLEAKKQLIDKAIDSIMDSNNDYGTLIKEALEMYLQSCEITSLWDLVYEGSDDAPNTAPLSYSDETIDMSEYKAHNTIAPKFIKEVQRLLNSGALDGEYHNRGLLFGVALENIADDYLRGERKSKEYKNLKSF